tara:strand:+ start:44329 stop:44913 length:585 start_codon:yes stop_codon:yes gene_type:complete
VALRCRRSPSLPAKPFAAGEPLAEKFVAHSFHVGLVAKSEPGAVHLFGIRTRNVAKSFLSVGGCLVDNICNLLCTRCPVSSARIHKDGERLIQTRLVGGVRNQFERAPCEIGFDATWRDGLHADAKLSDFVPEALRPAFKGPLGCVIHRVEGQGDEPANRCCGDKETCAFVAKVRKKLSSCAHNAKQICGELSL